MYLQNDLLQTPNLSKNPTHPLPNLPVTDKIINIKSFLSSAQPSYLPTLAKQSTANVIESLPPETLNEFTFTSRVQDLLKNSNKIKPQTSRHNHQFPLFISMPTQKISPEPMSATYREKRLTDIKVYKQKNFKGNLEDESPHKLKKSSSSGQLTRPERSQSRQSFSITTTAKPDLKRISERRLATVGPEELNSIALSTEETRIKTEETPRFASGTSNAILSMDSVSYIQPLKLQVNIPEKYEWKEYTEKASSPTFERNTLKTSSQQKRNIGTAAMTTRGSRSVERLQTLKPFYAQFVTENFKPDIVDRLDTLANFGFNTIEKDENVEGPEFLNNTSKINPGSMRVVDLWSKDQKNRVMKGSNLMDARRTVKKFLVHCVDKIKSPRKGPITGASFESQEGNFKSKVAAKELVKAVNKLQEEELMSPMRRHLSVKNKTFSKDTQRNKERVKTSISLSKRKDKEKTMKLVKGIDGIMNDLDKLEEETQEDYVKVLKFSNEYDAKYPPKELKAIYNMRKLNELLSTGHEKLKDVKNLDDSEEIVLI